MVEACGLESDADAKRMFMNLKKRYGKARANEKLSFGSGAQRGQPVDTYNYLAWLKPFYIMRSTKSNISRMQMMANEAAAEASSSSNENEHAVEDQDVERQEINELYAISVSEVE